jgi:hypothetical protein
MKPCIWCGVATDLRFIPEAKPELGPQPLHIFCAGGVILAYEAILAGRTLTTRQAERMSRLNGVHAALT